MGAYRDLMNRYVVDLRVAHEQALAWWDVLLERELAAVGGDPAAARQRINLRWPCGPVAFPRVIGVFRQYYLECEALEADADDIDEDDAADDGEESEWGKEDEDEDEENPDDVSWDDPGELLIDRLGDVDETLGEFMSSLVLFPVGSDEREHIGTKAVDRRPLPVLHNVESGIKRLLAAPRDLPRNDALASAISVSAASHRHSSLFEAYRAQLAGAVAEAQEWWRAMLGQAAARGLHGQAALRSLYTLRPAGPASDPAVVGVVRKYWLACDEANRSEPPGVAPEVLLINWPVELRMEPELVVLTAMPYWPIGMDAKGNWV